MQYTIWWLKNRSRFFVAVFFCFFMLAGCFRTLPSVAERIGRAQQVAIDDSALQLTRYPDDHFPLWAWQPQLSVCQGKDVHLYIEGDGLAWVTSSRISNNPTPLDPVALKLAVADPYPCKIYLGRPGQYSNSVINDRKYWTSHRFAPEVVERYQSLLTGLKVRYDIASFTLVGYSGGGAIAALLAADRDDVSLLVTVAGNLDTRFWTESHHLSPLQGSLNPADYADSLQGVRQLHLVGGKDKMVGKAVYEAYRDHFVCQDQLSCEEFEDFGHHCCWDQIWSDVITRLAKEPCVK